jgi:tellurite resistance protein TerA
MKVYGMTKDRIVSQDGLTQADRTQNEFSAYRGALGQAGVRDMEAGHGQKGEFLSRPGDQMALSPGTDGFGEIYIGCAWHIQTGKAGGILGLLGLNKHKHVDIDLGCLYELNDGTRGALQALGRDNGSFEAPPYIWLSHDERTGRAEGDDEFLRVNGTAWPHFKRLMIYAYIYHGVPDWASVRPDVTVRVPGQSPLHVVPATKRGKLAVCAIALIEQIRGGIKLTNLTEYFPGQAEMDRAYGFGINWRDGLKGP